MFVIDVRAWDIRERFNEFIDQAAFDHAITRNLLYSEYGGYSAYSNKSLNLMYAKFAA